MAEEFGTFSPDRFGLKALTELSAPHRDWRNLISNTAVRGVAHTFDANIDRPFHLATLFPILIFNAMQRTHWQLRAALNVLKDMDARPTTPAEQEAVLDSVQESAAKFIKTYASTESERFKLLYEDVLPVGLWITNDMLAAESEASAPTAFPVSNGMSAMLSSVMLGTWTALEVLVADLWVAVLNQRPRLGFYGIRRQNA